MGAWGVGPFDNDDAGDWAWGFAEADRATGIAIVDTALAAASDSPVEAPTGAIAVAAATVVTWLLGDVAHTESAYGADAVAAATVVTWLLGDVAHTESAYGADAVAWVRRDNAPLDGALLRAARHALERVTSADSELAELWREAGDDEWRAELQRLDAVLASGAA